MSSHSLGASVMPTCPHFTLWWCPRRVKGDEPTPNKGEPFCAWPCWLCFHILLHVLCLADEVRASKSEVIGCMCKCPPLFLARGTHSPVTVHFSFLLFLNLGSSLCSFLFLLKPFLVGNMAFGI